MNVKDLIEDDVGRDAHNGDSHRFANQRTQARAASCGYQIDTVSEETEIFFPDISSF